MGTCARAVKTPECAAEGAAAGGDGGDRSRCVRCAGGGFGVGPAADGGGRSWLFCYLPWGPFVLSSSSPLFFPLNADSCSTIYFSIFMREMIQLNCNIGYVRHDAEAD
jgi:hypothetical protein